VSEEKKPVVDERDRHVSDSAVSLFYQITWRSSVFGNSTDDGQTAVLVRPFAYLTKNPDALLGPPTSFAKGARNEPPRSPWSNREGCGWVSAGRRTANEGQTGGPVDPAGRGCRGVTAGPPASPRDVA